MADPRPPRPGLGGFADRVVSLEREVRRLKTPTGTQRADVAETLTATVDGLAARVSRFAFGQAQGTTEPGDSVERIYTTFTELEIVSTGAVAVSAYVYEARMTFSGTGTARIGLRMAVLDATTGDPIAGGSSGSSALLTTPRTIGASLGFDTLAPIPAGPVRIAILWSTWATAQTNFFITQPFVRARPV